MIKPLNQKAYGSIPHLPGSRLGEKDYCISNGQARIATEKTRNKHDLVIVQEKLDGSNVAVAKVDNKILPLTRSGYLATTSPFKQHHLFAEWVRKNENRFADMLLDGWRVCGEWLAMAHGTKYELTHEPFVAFDIMTGVKRLPYQEFHLHSSHYEFTEPYLLHIGEALPIESALLRLGEFGGHNALDKPEGAVWRVERKSVVDFLCKYVRKDKVDGKYFEELNGGIITWNCKPEFYL